jgi:hypothetical protein
MYKPNTNSPANTINNSAANVFVLAHVNAHSSEKITEQPAKAGVPIREHASPAGKQAL